MISIVDEERKPVALTGVSKRLRSIEENEAHARLIAAAPDLLEAAQNIENDGGSIPPTIWKMLKDAIAKATLT